MRLEDKPYGPEDLEWLLASREACNLHRDELLAKNYDLRTKSAALGKTCDVLGKRKHALELENEQLRGRLAEARLEIGDAKSRALMFYHELVALRIKQEVPPSTDHPELRAKHLVLEDGDQYLEPSTWREPTEIK